MPSECLCFDFALVQHLAPVCLQWPLSQLYPGAWADSTSQWSVYISLMSMVRVPYHNCDCDFYLNFVLLRYTYFENYRKIVVVKFC